ncbi:MAG: hypothetical protein NT113_12020 [Hyphomicrobiales bacterium]|nr:hypothetical protein [Hyphomicrobiales bacterium]
MDWSDLAKQVITLGAPLLGTALGGPLGGVAGEILARTIGVAVATPANVQAALPAADPNKLAEAEARWAAMIQAEAETQRAAISETQATIRAELASEDALQRWWRPVYALELTLECAALWCVLMHQFWTGDVQTIKDHQYADQCHSASGRLLGVPFRRARRLYQRPEPRKSQRHHRAGGARLDRETGQGGDRQRRREEKVISAADRYSFGVHPSGAPLGRVNAENLKCVCSSSKMIPISTVSSPPR